MVAVPLIKGTLTAEDYEDDVASDPRIDALRAKMVVTEDKRYSADYLDPSKRSIANAMQIFFRDTSKTDRVEIEYPIGHRSRRVDGISLLEEKFRGCLADTFAPKQAEKIEAFFYAPDFAERSVTELMELCKR